MTIVGLLGYVQSIALIYIFDKAKKDIISEKHPSKKFVDKRDVSKMVYYLTTDEAAQITGSNLIIDGGWSAQ